MREFNPLLFVKLGAVPPGILATIALMSELESSHQKEAEAETNGVDFENLVRETTKPPRQRRSPNQ
jgi:hypothetical protein